MSANVISHPTARRKRARASVWTMRRIGVLVVAAAAVAVASWLAPDLNRSTTPPPAAAPQIALPQPPPARPELANADLAGGVAGPAPRQRTRTAPRRNDVPLDAAGGEPVGYEILSAAELANISQARE
ncbi:MAG: hypothetical protein AB7H66_07840 [Hyphomonadaceae bacterium]